MCLPPRNFCDNSDWRELNGARGLLNHHVSVLLILMQSSSTLQKNPHVSLEARISMLKDPGECLAHYVEVTPLLPHIIHDMSIDFKHTIFSPSLSPPPKTAIIK